MEPEEQQVANIDYSTLSDQPGDNLENEPMPIISEVQTRMTEPEANQLQPPEYGMTIVIKGPGTGKFGAPLNVPAHTEPISTFRLIQSVRRCLRWLTPENINPLRQLFEQLYQTALMRMRDSRIYIEVLLRLRYLATRLNQLIAEAERMLDVTEIGDLPYEDLRCSTVGAGFSSTSFQELQQELRLIQNLEKAIWMIEATNNWITQHVPQRAFSIPTNNLIPRFHSIEALYKSFLSVLEVCKVYAHKVLQEISEVSGRIQNTNLTNKQQLLQMIHLLEIQLANIIQQMHQFDQWATTPLIRPDKAMLLLNLTNLMNVIRQMCRLRTAVLNVNTQYEQNVVNQVPLRPTAVRSVQLQAGWNKLLEWSHSAQQMIRDLNIHRKTEYDIRTRPLERMPADQLQQLQQQLEYLQEMQDIEDIAAKNLEEMETEQKLQDLEEIIAKDLEEMQARKLQVLDAKELEEILAQLEQPAEEQQQPDVKEQTQAEDAVAESPPAPGTRSIWDYVLQRLNTSEPESSQPNWRTTPGGAAGHSRGSATVSRPPDDDDDEESPSPKRVRRV